MSYGAPEEKKAKLDLDMNKKKSVEPPKDDRNVAPVTKTETESAEMVEARQRAEIEKVFEIARAQAAAKALEPKSKAGLKTKSQIEKRKTDKEAFKAQQKKKEKQVPSKPIVDSSNVQPQSNKENENKKAMPTVPPAPPSKEKLCHDIFAGVGGKNSILESLPSSLAVRRVKSSQTKVLLEAKQSLAEKQTQSATVKKPAQFEKESNDVQWAEAKRKAAMLGDIKKKEEFLKSRVADLRRKLQDQKKMKDPKENCNNTPIVLPDEIIATKVPKEKKKAQDDFKTMQKSETCVDPFEEAAKKAAKLEEIKQREQTLIQRLAMLTEKLNKKKRLASAVEKSPEIFEPEICIKEEVAEVKPDSLGGRDGLLGGQDSQEVDHVVEASNPKLTTVEEKMARLQLLKKLKEEKRKKALVEKRVMKEKKVMEEKKALEEEKRAIENKKTMEEKKASDEKKALEENKSLEENRALMEKKAMEEKKALEEKRVLEEEKAKEEKKALEEEKRAIEEKRVVEEKRASEGKKSIEEKEKMALEEKKAFDEKKALEEMKVMKEKALGETEKDINKAREKIVSEEKIKKEAERRLRNIQAKEAALQFKRDLDAKREIEKARLKEEEEEIKRKEINAAEMLDQMRWASFPIPSNFSASKPFLRSNFGLNDNLSYQDGRWRWLPRRRRSRGRRSGGT